MTPVDGVLLRWALFAGTHIGLGTTRVRAALVARLGERGFAVLFSVLAALTFTPLVRFYAAHRFEGPPGVAAADVPLLRWPLAQTALAGATLGSAALVAFRPSTMTPFGARVPEVRGLDRITRHPFFVGVAMLGAAHALLATRLVGTAWFGCLTAFTVVGMRLQDRKLLRARGPAYARWLDATSATPFAALVAGRQTLPRWDVPWGPLAGGVVAALALRAAHPDILARDGLWVVIAVVGGAAVILLRGFRTTRGRAHTAPL